MSRIKLQNSSFTDKCSEKSFINKLMTKLDTQSNNNKMKYSEILSFKE